MHLVSSAAFVLAGLFIIVVDPSPRSFLIAVPGMLFFGWCGAVFLRQFRDSGPRIIIDDEGIFDRSLKIGVIPWDRILGANAQSIGGAMFVSLRVRNAEDFLGTLGPVRRQLAIANKALGFEPLNLNLANLDADAHVLAELITKEATRRQLGDPVPYREEH